MPNDDRALVVGISSYPGIRDLKGPPNDVDSIISWLVDPSRGNLDPNNVTRVVSNDTGRPILSDVTGFFTALMREQQNRATPRLGRRLYLFLSGHGFADTRLSQAALCMADSDAKIYFFPHLGGQAYADDLAYRGMFDEVFLWMDCCRELIFGMTINPPTFRPPNPPHTASRFFWGFATGAGQMAAEAQMLVGQQKRPHGVFTALLLEALESCPTRPNGDVSAQDVAIYIKNRMPQVLGDSAPSPRFQSDPAQDLVLYTRAVVPNPTGLTPAGATQTGLQQPGSSQVTFRFEGASDNDQILITTGQNVPVLAGPVLIANGQAITWLTPGIYKAVLAGTARSGLFEVPKDSVVTL